MLFSGTRSSTRALKSNGFDKLNEVRITRNTYYDTVLLKKKPNYRIIRRNSEDERRRSSHKASNQTSSTPKSILKKPKRNPFGITGRRKSTDGRINMNSVAGSMIPNSSQMNQNSMTKSIGVSTPFNSIVRPSIDSAPAPLAMSYSQFYNIGVNENSVSNLVAKSTSSRNPNPFAAAFSKNPFSIRLKANNGSSG